MNIARILATVAAVALFARSASADPVLVEGFEDITKVKVDEGKLSPIKGGEGVTQGAQAASFPPKCAVTVQISGQQLQGNGWLKIDTMTVQPTVGPVLLRFSGKRLDYAVWACVQAGKDTLSMPVSLVRHRVDEMPEQVALTISNPGDFDLIMDNVRFERPAGPPEECFAVDFGWDNQPSWPGFEAGGIDNRHVSWSGDNRILAMGRLWPDIFIGDYVGRNQGPKITEYFNLNSPGTGPAVAWLWMTHYGSYNLQPPEYMVKMGAKTLAQKRLDLKQMLGVDCLFEGLNGEWTPKWFDTEFANHYADLVQVNIPAGKTRFDLGNAQIAALVIGPLAKQSAMSDYVESVKKDLTRYRRQFVLGYRVEPICQIQPTDEQAKEGAMAFAPPVESALTARWRPTEDQLAKTVSVLAGNGQPVTVPLAVVGLKASPFISATPSVLRTKEGKILHTGADGVEVFFLERVPRVRNAAVEFQPWVMTHRHGPVKEREIVHAVVIVRPLATAAAGVYQGSVKFTFAGGSATAQIEVEVLNVGAPPDNLESLANACVMHPPGARDAYLMLTDVMPDTAQETATLKLRQFLQANRFDGIGLTGPYVNRRLQVDENPMVRDLKTYPKGMTGRSIVWEGQPWEVLTDEGVAPSSEKYQETVNQLVKQTNALCGKSMVRNFYIFTGWANREDHLAYESRKAAAITSAGGTPIVGMNLSSMMNIPADAQRNSLERFKAIVISPNGGTLAAKIADFKNGKPDRQAYIYMEKCDRFLTGFYSAAAGADGFYLGQVLANCPVYSGYALEGEGPVMLLQDGSFTQTLGMLRIWEGLDDFLLVRRAEALLKKVKGAGGDAAELEKVLNELKEKVAGMGTPSIDGDTLRSRNMKVADLNTWRERILRAMSSANDASKKPG